jgi:hypothetical protein
MRKAERARRSRETETVRALLGRTLSAYGLAEDVREHRIVTEWPAIVGARVAARTRPDGLARGVLWVRVVNSAWLQELSFVKVEIVMRANQILGPPPLCESVRLHIDARTDAGVSDPDDCVAALARRPPPRPYPRRTFDPPDTEHARRIEAETARMDDGELRAALRELRLKVGM